MGKRMSIKATRACINAILDGSINKAEFETFPVFNLQIPRELAGVETVLLNPRNTWESKTCYDERRIHLAGMFAHNFQKYLTENTKFDYSGAGPTI